jgi:hypothetical protein
MFLCANLATTYHNLFLELFFLGLIPILFLLLYSIPNFKRNKYVGILAKFQKKKFLCVNELGMCIEFFLYLASTYKERFSFFLLGGYLTRHLNTCKMPDCPLTRFSSLKKLNFGHGKTRSKYRDALLHYISRIFHNFLLRYVLLT